MILDIKSAWMYAKFAWHRMMHGCDYRSTSMNERGVITAVKASCGWGVDLYPLNGFITALVKLELI